MADPMFWGKLIVDLRMQQGLSQRQLASATSVNRSTLRRIEQDGGGDITIIETVLEYLGYELEAEPTETLQEVRTKRLKAEADPTQRSRIAAALIAGFTFPR
jgi:transcriptional regulator with XRE-family HTH domain